MGKILVHEFMSLDGVVDAPLWTFEYGFTDEMGELLTSVMEPCRGILLGRTTYQIFIDYWPTATTDTAIIADDLNALSKVVVSRTLGRAPWGDRGDEATIVRDGVEAAAALRRQSGKGVVVWGSLTLARSLLQAGLVDECQLYVCPSVLGAGKPLFAPDARLQAMRLLQATRYDSGVVLLRYAPEAGPATVAPRS